MNKQKIKVNNNILYKTKIIEVQGDFIVPDSKPDIVNIINTNGNAYIYKKECSMGKIRIDGNIDCNIIYLAATGETRAIQYTLNFAENIEDDKIFDNIYFNYNLKINNINTKILNERKISLKIQMEIACAFKEPQEIEILDNVDDVNNIEKLEDTLNIKNFITLNSVKTSVKENLNLEQGNEVAEILKTNINVINSENKISYNKVLAKAEANVEIIYLTEDDRVCIAKGTFPIMSFIDAIDIKEEYICDIDYKIKNITIIPNNKDENTILIQIDFEVVCEISEYKKINVLKDIYSTSNNISCTKNTLFINSPDLNTNSNKIKVEDKIFVEDINKIIDIEILPSITSKKEYNGIANYEGELDVNILYEVENKNGIYYKEVKIPFAFNAESNKLVELKIVNQNNSLINENINLEVEIEILEKNANLQKVELLEDISVGDPIDNNLDSVIIYFVKPEDTLWSIGKSFKVSLNNINEFNDIEESKIYAGEKLYIIR